MDLEQIGKIIFFHRKKAGLAREDLAHLSGIGKTVIYDIEKGKLTVRVSSLLKIMATLNLQFECKGPLMNLYKELK